MPSNDLTNLFLFEMELQGITTLEDLFTLITDKERDNLVKAVCSHEFIREYNKEKRCRHIRQ